MLVSRKKQSNHRLSQRPNQLAHEITDQKIVYVDIRKQVHQASLADFSRRRLQDKFAEVKFLSTIERDHSRGVGNYITTQDGHAVGLNEAFFSDRPKLRVETSSRIIYVQLLKGTLNEIFSTIDEIFEIYEQKTMEALGLKLYSLKRHSLKAWTAVLTPQIS